MHPQGSINRNIVECKEIGKKSYRCLVTGINRNIVECKAEGYVKTFGFDPVLIETLWNVKFHQ